MPRAVMSVAGAAVATLLLQLAVAGLGPFAVFLNLLVPLPVALLVVHYGLPAGSLGVLLVTAALWGSAGLSGCGAYLLQFGIASLLLPVLLRRGWAWDRATLVSLVVTLLLGGSVLAGYTALQGRSLPAAVDDYIQGEVATAKALSSQGELPGEQQAQLEEFVNRMGDFLAATLPAWVVTITGGMLLLQVLLLQRFARGRLQLQGVPFVRWKAPELLVWALIAGGFAVFFAEGALRLIGMNLLVILLPVYFLQGMAVVSYFFDKKAVAPGLRVIGYLLIALLNPMPMIVTGVGVFDLWADFRKPRVKQT